jgi:DNA-binding NtrC family response regulator
MIDPATRILVVDDGDAIRTLMRRVLGKLGYQDVRVADSVQMGLDAFAQQGSEVVFLDCAVGSEEGADFARVALADRPDTRIVVMTAYPASHAEVTKLVALGARDLLPKPIQAARVREILENLAEDDLEEDDLGEPPGRADASYV